MLSRHFILELRDGRDLAADRSPPLRGRCPAGQRGVILAQFPMRKPPPNNGSGTHLANQLPLPPHFPLATLKLPQDIGFLQSEIRSFESGR
jgi:hypothetical protein